MKKHTWKNKGKILQGSVLGTSLLILLCLGAPLRAQSTWKVETVDTGLDVGSSIAAHCCALAIDHDGNFHLGYSRNALWYAYRGKDDKQWFKMGVFKEPASYMSLVADKQDRPHFVFNTPLETGLHYAYWDGTTWHQQLLDPGKTDYFDALSMDAEGHPSVSYYLYHRPDGTNIVNLKFAHYDGKEWIVETVDPHFGTGKWNSLALDKAGHPHIAYSNVGQGDLKYAYWDGKQWNFQTPDTRRTENHYVGQGNTIALDAAGKAHIAYYDLNGRTVKYAYQKDGVWQNEVIDHLLGRADLVDHASIKIDSLNQPHVAYYDSGLGGLKYAVRIDGKWKIEVVDQDGNVGRYASLCLDSHNVPYIAYYDATGGAVRVAHLENHPAPAATATAAPKQKP